MPRLLLLADRPPPASTSLVDDLNIVFILLNTFVGFTTSAFSASYIGHELEIGRLTPNYLRFYHAMFQLMLFGMNLALIANNIGLMWVAVELATLTTVVMVGIYRTHEAIEAAWKYFILGSVGIALALFGTILVYLAARPVVGEGIDAMVWTVLITRARDFDPALLNIAFIFLLLGYGTKVGLAPMHAWLPDAHAEGPTPISAVLSGLLLNVALYALLRFKMLLAANPAAIAPGPLMIALGLISLIFAAFMLYRRRDIKRMFAYSSIEHMGITVFAFGMAGPLGNFAGLLQMTMHSLTKSAIFFSVGHVAQVKGTQRIAEMGGLTATHPLLGWGLIAGVAAIAGLPPFGVFTSEFLVVSSTFAREPLLAILFVFGLLVSFGALFLRVTSVAFGEPRGPTGPVTASYVPMFAHLALVLIAGIWLPGPLVAWFQHVAAIAGMTGVDTAYWQEATRCLAAGEATLLSLWGEPGRVHMAVLDNADVVVLSLDCPDKRYPSVGALHRAGDSPGTRGTRSVRARASRPARHAPVARSRREPDRLSVPAGGGRRPAPDSGRPGPRRHHRARPFPLHRRWRNGGAARTAAGLRAQGHRPSDARRDAGSGRAAGRPHLGRQHRRLCIRLRPRGGGGARHRAAAARGLAARPDGGTGAHRQSPRRFRRDLQRRVVQHHAGALRHAARARAALRRRVLRPSADDGLHRPGRRRGRSARRWGWRHPLAGRRDTRALPGAGGALRQDRVAAGPHGRHRHRVGRAGAPLRRRRLCRPRLGARFRRAPVDRLSAV